jgi:hypothetical protein
LAEEQAPEVNKSPLKNLDITKSDAQIEVCNPITKEEKFAKFTLFTVKGFDRNDSFEVQRRYSDFDKIRSILVTRWPGVYIPPLPPKKAVNNLDAKFIEERRKGLDVFCKAITAISYLHYSEEYQLFIKTTSGDIEKLLLAYSKTIAEELISRYAVFSTTLAGKELNNEVMMRITNFRMLITKGKGYLENFRKISERTVAIGKEYYSQISTFHDQVAVPYEKNIYSKYHEDHDGKNVFANPSNAKLNEQAEKLKEAASKESFSVYDDYLGEEIREIESFLEAIEQREKFEALKIKAQEKQKSETEDLHKVLAGKTTMKTFFSKKPKEEEVQELEKNIATTAQEVQNLNTAFDMITMLLAYDQIPKFKATKVDAYYKKIAILAQQELANIATAAEYWQTVVEDQNLQSLSQE